MSLSMIDTKELLRDMRCDVIWTRVATMPIPLYERMKEAIKQLATQEQISKELEEQKGGDLSDKLLASIGVVNWREWSLQQKIQYVKGSGGGFNLKRHDIATLDDESRDVHYKMKTIRMAVDVIDDLSKQLTATQQALDSAVEAKNTAYTERNLLVAALSKLFPAWIERHPDSDTSWDKDWRNIIFLNLPTGQVSWHIHDAEFDNFQHLPQSAFGVQSWDGHTTAEKYERLSLLPSDTKEKEKKLIKALEFYATKHWEGGIPYKEPILPPRRALSREEDRSGIVFERLEMEEKIDTGQIAKAALASIKE